MTGTDNARQIPAHDTGDTVGKILIVEDAFYMKFAEITDDISTPLVKIITYGSVQITDVAVRSTTDGREVGDIECSVQMIEVSTCKISFSRQRECSVAQGISQFQSVGIEISYFHRSLNIITAHHSVDRQLAVRVVDGGLTRKSSVGECAVDGNIAVAVALIIESADEPFGCDLKSCELEWRRDSALGADVGNHHSEVVVAENPTDVNPRSAHHGIERGSRHVGFERHVARC